MCLFDCLSGFIFTFEHIYSQAGILSGFRILSLAIQAFESSGTKSWIIGLHLIFQYFVKFHTTIYVSIGRFMLFPMFYCFLFSDRFSVSSLSTNSLFFEVKSLWKYNITMKYARIWAQCLVRADFRYLVFPMFFKFAALKYPKGWICIMLLPGTQYTCTLHWVVIQQTWHGLHSWNIRGIRSW